MAAGEFVGIAGQGRLIEAHLGEQFAGGVGAGAEAGVVAMDPIGFGEDLANGHARVEGSERILEDRLHPSAKGARVEFTGGKATESGKISIDLPEIAENGNTVPLAIKVDSPMTALLARFARPAPT